MRGKLKREFISTPNGENLLLQVTCIKTLHAMRTKPYHATKQNLLKPSIYCGDLCVQLRKSLLINAIV